MGCQRANGKGFIGLEQVVKLAAVGVEFGLQVKDTFEHVLHIGNGRANGKPATDPELMPAETKFTTRLTLDLELLRQSANPRCHSTQALAVMGVLYAQFCQAKP